MSPVKTNGLSRRASTARSALQAEIERGRFVDVERLPGERDLARAFSVSRTTLRRAIADLIASGLLHQRHGFGTYVSRSSQASRPPPSLPPIHSGLVDLTRAFGPMVHFDGTSCFGPATFSIDTPLPDEAVSLQVPTDDRVWRRTRPVMIEGQTVAIETTLVPLEFRPVEEVPTTDRVVLRIDDQSIARMRQRIRTVTLNRQIAEALCGQKESSGLFIERTLILGDRRCLALRRLACAWARIDCLHDIVVTPAIMGDDVDGQS